MNIELIKKIVLYILLISALVLGFLIYKQNRPESTEKIIDTDTQIEIDSELFSENEKKILMAPGPQSTKQEIDDHSRLAAELSVVGDRVIIKDCKADPLVLRTEFGSTVPFENKDSSAISISFDDKNILEIKAGKTGIAKDVFVHGPGLYGYLCSKGEFKGLVGFILLTQ